MRYLIAILAVILAGCATTISGPGSATGVPISASSVLGKDLIAAAYNLDNAVLVGALSDKDPAPACIHGVLQQAGIEVPPGSTPPGSFEPKNDGLVSLGSIAYIKAQQLKGLKGVTVPVDCKALIGTFVIDGLTAPGTVLRAIVR